tara:strand:+ start:259 stop:819 length:561 start_codon:yes stop_codon:yes gene_type:complete
MDETQLNLLNWVLFLIAIVLRLIAFFINRYMFCKENKDECNTVSNFFPNIINKINSSKHRWFFNTADFISFGVAILTFYLYRLSFKDQRNSLLNFLNTFTFGVAGLAFLLRVIDVFITEKNNGLVKAYEYTNYVYYGLYILLLIFTLGSGNEKIKGVLEKFNPKLQRQNPFDVPKNYKIPTNEKKA